jgi:hypothetical protein
MCVQHRLGVVRVLRFGLLAWSFRSFVHPSLLRCVLLRA